VDGAGVLAAGSGAGIRERSGRPLRGGGGGRRALDPSAAVRGDEPVPADRHAGVVIDHRGMGAAVARGGDGGDGDEPEPGGAEAVGEGNRSGGTIPVGSHPVAVEFDGANVWVANSGSNTVQKL
jgi:DNA-binding beta-propeller fold protein YncE